MLQTIVVIRRAEKLIPEDYVEHIAKLGFSDGLGVALFDPGKKSIISRAIPHPVDAEYSLVACVNETQSGDMKKSPIILAFHKNDNEMAPEDVMPYLMCGPGDDPAVVAFITAQCLPSEQAQSAHPPVYHAAYNHLMPRLERTLKVCKGDLVEFENWYLEELAMKDLMSAVAGAGNEGSIVMLTKTGKIMPISAELASKEFEWGWVSDVHGYGVPVTVTPEPPKPKGRLGLAIGQGNGGPKTETPKADPKPVSEPQKTAAELKTTAAAIQPNSAMINAARGTLIPDVSGLIWPPTNRLGNKGELNSWYKQHGDHTAVVSMKNDHREWVKTGPGVKPKVVAASEPIKSFSDLGNHHIPNPPPAKSLPAVGLNAYIVPTPTKQKILDSFLGKGTVMATLDANSQEVVEPKLLQGIDGDFPTIAEALGLKMEDVLRWKWIGGYDIFVKEYPNEAAHLMHDMRMLVVSMARAMHKKVDDELKEKNKEPVAAPSAATGGKKAGRVFG